MRNGRGLARHRVGHFHEPAPQAPDSQPTGGLVLDMLPLLEKDAKERQRLSAGRGKKVAKELATFSKRGKSSQFAAKLTGTNSAYVEQVKSVRRKAPELLDQVRSGNLTASEANRLTKLDAFQRERFFAAKAEQPNEKFNRLIRQVLPKKEPHSRSSQDESLFTNQVEVWCGDCLKLMPEKIPPESINVICTSPPFNRGLAYPTYGDNLDPAEYSEWLDEVFNEFHRVLTPSGSFFLVVGHSPRCPFTAFNMVRIAAQFFILQNQIIWVKSISIDDQSHGHFTPIPGDRYLNRNWDFVFHFTKKGTAKLDRRSIGVPYVDSNNAVRSGDGDDVRCAGDVWFIPFETVHDGNERGHHPATCPPDLIVRCLKLAGCTSGMTFLDPFCGVNGLKAANRLAINAIGIDIDQGYCEAAAASAGTTVQFFPANT